MGTDRIAHDVTEDAVLGGRLRLRQPSRGHRVGHDAILLAAAVPARAGEAVLDLGAGVGAAGLALAARVGGIKLTLVEIARPAQIAHAASNGMKASAAGNCGACRTAAATGAAAASCVIATKRPKIR